MTKTEIDPGWEWDDAFLYSQGIQVGDLLFISGQAALAEDGSIVGPGNFKAQAHQVFKNLNTVLNQAGAGLGDIVKVTVFVTDMQNFPAFVELRKEYFSPPYPADTIAQVQSLALPELMIEVEAIAVLPE